MEGKNTAGVTAQARSTEPDAAERALTGHSTWPARDQVFQYAPVGIHEVDADGRLVRVNPAFCRMTGYAPDELVGRSIADIADRSVAPDSVERFQELLHGGAGVTRFDLGYLRKDGSLLQGRVTASVIPGTANHAASAIALVEDATGDLPAPDDAAFAARIDAVETVADAVAQAREAAYEKGIDIAFAYATAPVWVRADQVELRRAVDELLASAVRSRQLGSLAVRCTARDGDALLEVLELGETGAAGADLAVAFDDRPDSEPTAARPAKALSLGSLRALARAHDGDVGITSSPETGSRITLRLPLARG